MSSAKKSLEKIRSYWQLALSEKYRKYRPAGFFVLGFLFDILTMSDIDNFISLGQQFLYIFVSAWILRQAFLEQQCLWVPSVRVAKVWKHHIEILHFILGGLLSIYTLFYFVSASLSSSLFFLALLFLLLVVNELPQFKKLGLSFKFTLLFVCLNSFILFTLPMLAGIVSSLAFAAAILISLLLTYLAVLHFKKRGLEREQVLRQLVTPNLIVAGVLVLLYFVKILPPVPLATKYMGIYHSVSKEDGRYKLGYTRGAWRFWQNGDQSFYARQGDRLVCFVRIFAPSSIEQNVVFHWQRYEKGRWTTMDEVPIKISGGRRHGYRGYVKKSNYVPGDWRVLMENEDGREFGRIEFEVIADGSSASDSPSELAETRYDYF